MSKQADMARPADGAASTERGARRLIVGRQYMNASWWGGVVTYLGPYSLHPSNRMAVVSAEWASADWFTAQPSALIDIDQ